MPEVALQRAGLRLVRDDVERLAGVLERALDQVVVVRGQDEQLLVGAALAQKRRQTREQPVERARRIVGVEDVAELLVQRPPAEDRVEVLRDPQQVGIAGVRELAVLGERPGQLTAARGEAAQLPGSLLRPVAEVRPRTQERDDVSSRDRLRDEREVPIIDVHVTPSDCSSARTPQILALTRLDQTPARSTSHASRG